MCVYSQQHMEGDSFSSSICPLYYAVFISLMGSGGGLGHTLCYKNGYLFKNSQYNTGVMYCMFLL